jgi:hypothetical protein
MSPLPKLQPASFLRRVATSARWLARLDPNTIALRTFTTGCLRLQQVRIPIILLES